MIDNNAAIKPVIYFSHGNILKGTEVASRCLSAITQNWPEAQIMNPGKINIAELASKMGGWDRLYDDVISRLQKSGGHMVVLENGQGYNTFTVGRGVAKEVSLALQSTAVEIPVYAWRNNEFVRILSVTPEDEDDWTHRYAVCHTENVLAV